MTKNGYLRTGCRQLYLDFGFYFLYVCGYLDDLFPNGFKSRFSVFGIAKDFGLQVMQKHISSRVQKKTELVGCKCCTRHPVCLQISFMLLNAQFHTAPCAIHL